MEFFFNWYLWYYLFLGIMAYIYFQQKNKSTVNADGTRTVNSGNDNDEYKASFLFSILVYLPLIWLAGTRSWEIADKYGDTGVYINMYKDAPSSLNELLGNIDWDSKYPGFEIIMSFVKQISGVDYQGFFWIIAIIQGVCLIVFYRYYTKNIVIVAFLFFASTDYMSWMMNGTRQFLVVTILLAAFPLVQKKRFFLFIIIVLLLFTVHRSVLIVIPLYIASLGKPFNKRTITILVLCLIAIVFAGQFTNLMDEGLQETAYSNMVSEFEGDNGTNILRALVYSIPAIIAIFNRNKLNEDTPEIINISVNMSLFTAGLYLLSVPISGIYMGRLPIYCTLFSYILLPWELKHFFREDMYKTLILVMITLYFSFYIYQMLQWGI